MLNNHIQLKKNHLKYTWHVTPAFQKVPVSSVTYFYETFSRNQSFFKMSLKNKKKKKRKKVGISASKSLKIRTLELTVGIMYWFLWNKISGVISNVNTPCEFRPWQVLTLAPWDNTLPHHCDAVFTQIPVIVRDCLHTELLPLALSGTINIH